jgi:hypothetical protein
VAFGWGDSFGFVFAVRALQLRWVPSPRLFPLLALFLGELVAFSEGVDSHFVGPGAVVFVLVWLGKKVGCLI